MRFTRAALPVNPSGNPDYSVHFAKYSGEKARAQIKAFEDTWTRDHEAAAEYQDVVRAATTARAERLHWSAVRKSG